MKTLNIFKYCALSAVFALSVQLAVASPSIPLYEKSFSFIDASPQAVSQYRDIYMQAKQAFKDGDFEKGRALQSSLPENYPLNLWLDYFYLSREPSTAKFNEVMRFIKENKQKELSRLLRNTYVHYLANRGQYSLVDKLLPTKPFDENAKLNSSQKALMCRFYESKWQNGKGSEEAVAFASKLYLQLGRQPSDCNGLFAIWNSRGYLTDRIKLEKFERAYIQKSYRQTTNSLASSLSSSSFASRVNEHMKYYSDPLKIFDSLIVNSKADKRIAVLAFKRFAKQNPSEAADLYSTFVNRFNPSEIEAVDIKKILAENLLSRGRPLSDVKWVDKNLPAVGWTENIKELRLRRAIWFAQWETVYKLLQSMNEDFVSQINWKYWLGRSVYELGRIEEGSEILAEVAKDRSFFGFLAAQFLDEDLPFNEETLSSHASWPGSVKNDPAVIRFFELYGMDDGDAVFEWREIAKNSDDDTAMLMAEWALRQGNTAYAIDSVVSSGRWDALAYRFPIVYFDIYEAQSKEQGVSLSFMYGVSRQESMLNPSIRSPVGAVGLMQLMPGTAKMVSRQRDWSYNGTQDLVIPEKNVRLGAAYLRDMLDKFGNNRILAAAAYNAGPGRVVRWESKDGIKRDAAMYVENIPFAETRKYVQNVLLYDAIYQKLLTGKEGALLYANEINYNY